MKEYRHFKRYPMRLAGNAVMPLLWLIPVVLAGETFGGGMPSEGFAHYTGIQDYRSFLILGTVLWSFVVSTFFGVGFSLKEEMWQGTLEQSWLTPTGRTQLLLGKSLFALALTLVFTVTTIAVAYLVFGLRIKGNFGLGAAVVFLTLLSFVGFGLAFSGFVLFVREPMAVANIFMTSLPFLCGSMYSIKVFPAWLQSISLCIPLTIALDALRGILLGAQTVLPARTEVALLAAYAALLPLGGYLVFMAIEKQSRKRGFISQY